MPFVPSMELAQELCEHEVEPLMAERFPGLKYAAATLGMCSEVLGLDDEVSMDHEWGPRITLFLSEQDRARYGDEVMAALRALLPARFQGLDMMWRQPGVDVHDTREKALYHVWVSTVGDALRFCGGKRALPLQDVDWLRVSEQHLLEFTSGQIYRDDTGDLTRAREALAYYPDDVLRFLLIGEWSAVGGDWFPLGRIGPRGDHLGLRIQVAQIARHLMRIGFMVSRRYWTYSKWFGTLFKELPIADELEPVLSVLLAEEDWRQVEERVGQAAAILIRHQNALGIAASIGFELQRSTDPRHHMQYDFSGIVRELGQDLPLSLQSVMDNQVFWLHERSLILWNQEGAKWPMLLQK